MESRKTHLNFKPHELYMNLSPLTICSCLIFVTSVTVAFDYVSFVHDASREICPYTNFCQTNASMTLKDDEVSCCLPCSCSDNCAEMNGDCCPDKTVRIKLAPLAKCKAVIVKRKIGDSRRYDGYSYNVPRYRVVDTCLGDENNLTLVADCEGNKSTIEHFLWVSDKTGRIFDNRFCALCNGLDSDEIVVWGLRTSCISVLKSNYFSLSATLLSNQCDIRLELPSKEAHVIQNARCFTPSISRCNQTGHWDHHNSSIETACATFDSPVLYFPPDDGRKGANVHLVKIFKNLYCVACNERTSRSPSPLCPQIKPTDGRKQFSTFSILVDYVHVRSAKEGLQDKDDEKKHCATDEVRDSYKGRCLKLICPFGSMAYQESCRKIALDSQKLTTLIRYRLKTTGVSSGSQEALDLLGKNDLGLAIANNFKLKSGAQRRKCFSCADHIYMVGDNATEFFLSITFYTSSVCNLDTIFALGTHVVGKTQKVKYGKSQSFILNVVGILNRSISDLRYKAGLTLLYSYFKLWCGPYNTISKETFCPEVSIDSSEITYLENQTALRVTESGLNGTTSVCWNDYMLAMSKIYKSASPRQYHLAVFSMAVCVEFF